MKAEFSAKSWPQSERERKSSIMADSVFGVKQFAQLSRIVTGRREPDS